MTSFEFKFTKETKNQPEGKVFSTKKLKLPSKDGNNESKISEKITKGKGTYRKFTKAKFDNKRVPDSGKSIEDTTFIKRKGKKDKLKNNDQEITAQSSFEKSGAKHHSLFSEKYKNVHINANIKGVSVVEKVFSAGKKFSGLEIHKHLMSNLEKHQYTILTNVQEKSIPAVLSGHNCLVSMCP